MCAVLEDNDDLFSKNIQNIKNTKHSVQRCELLQLSRSLTSLKCEQSVCFQQTVISEEWTSGGLVSGDAVFLNPAPIGPLQWIFLMSSYPSHPIQIWIKEYWKNVQWCGSPGAKITAGLDQQIEYSEKYYTHPDIDIYIYFSRSVFKLSFTI